MAFKFTLGEQVHIGVQRMAQQQIEAALLDLTDPSVRGTIQSLHDARKRCKKVRALVRLVRIPLGTHYRRANTACRDAARLLAPYYEPHSLLLAFDRMELDHGAELPDGGLGPVRAQLSLRAARAAASGEIDSAMEAAGTLLAKAAVRIESWSFDQSGWQALASGVTAVHGQGAVALERALAKPTADRLHELRKHAKYTRYQLRMLRPMAPSLMLPMFAPFEELTDWLGDAHDLALLEAQIVAAPDDFGGSEMAAAAHTFMATRQAELERAGLSRAVFLYSEGADAFANRLGGYWQSWQNHGPEQVITADA